MSSRKRVENKVDLVHHLNASFLFRIVKKVIAIENHVEKVKIAYEDLLDSFTISENDR